ncbi:MAG: tetratricopeptide repeat protein [Desulfobacterales bacterium]|nr:tetratricopeptide repeat protein [Desulfobacterales bacterium]
MRSEKSLFFNLRSELFVCLFLVTAVLAVYWQTRNHSFVSYDDGQYVAENQYVQAGITVEGIVWAFTAIHASNWHPLTWLSHMADVHFYGINPGQHHLTNVLFHIVNTLLLFLIFKKMTGKIWQSGFVAALFGLHPLHAESVAWVAERKDVLSTFFWMLAVRSYIKYTEHPTFKSYLPVFVFFAMGLMAKPMVVTLPFVLLLLDHWPLRRLMTDDCRLSIEKINRQSTIDNHQSSIVSHQSSIVNHQSSIVSHQSSVINHQSSIINRQSSIFLEKIPLLLLSAGSCFVTVFAQKDAASSLEVLPLTIRIANALISYVSYIGKTIWPCNLAFMYPHIRAIQWYQASLSCLFLVFVTLFVVSRMKQKPCLIVGWMWYLGTLVPVIGLVQVGIQAMADRYTYVPLIGLFIMMAWGLETDNNEKGTSSFKFQVSSFKFILPVMAYFSVLMTSTWMQAQHWKNSITLYEHAINVTDNNELAHYNMGNVSLCQGKLDKAIIHLSEALRLNPGNSRGHNDLGAALFYKGNRDEGVAHFRKALQIKPDFVEARDNLQKALEVLKRDAD